MSKAPEPRFPPNVSRETKDRLSAYVDLLRSWQTVKNLVSEASLEHVWTRHICDSAQIITHRPNARRWLDLGSGAGFPGMVTAILLADDPVAEVHLVESNRRKTAFLNTVIRETGARAIVHPVRIEDLDIGPIEPVEAISARALAPLEKLCELIAPFMGEKTVGVFHKGQDFVSELEIATQYWGFDLLQHKNHVDEAGRIIVLSNLRRKIENGQKNDRA